jgi:RNA polymerase sigma-70 factor, ECF subfamily
MTAADARFIEIYESSYRHVYAYCRRRTSADRVDDAVADTYLTVWRKIDEVPTGDECLPWLYGVAYRVLGHQYRGASRSGRLAQKLASVGADPISLPEEYVVMRDECRLVLEALGSLKPADQEILRLTVWEEISHAEAAVALGISQGAARQRLHEARKNLTRQYTRLEKRHRPVSTIEEGGARWQRKNA